ncbi:MAG: hypothetical protein V8Q79_00080 [Christensenellales bacterium]
MAKKAAKGAAKKNARSPESAEDRDAANSKRAQTRAALSESPYSVWDCWHWSVSSFRRTADF